MTALRPHRPRLFVVGIALVLASCGGSSAISAPAEPSSTVPSSTEPRSQQPSLQSIPNDGTSQWEGHTPRGFAGSGTGLFAGDNLNSNFPNGDGVQIWLTFALPNDAVVPESAILRSSALESRGEVFEALGELQAAPVSYERFGPALFDLAPTGDLVSCSRPADGELACDVTNAARSAIEAGDSRVQFRLTFETISDNDGQQDLALFFLTDSNTNEPGIFTLDLASGGDESTDAAQATSKETATAIPSSQPERTPLTLPLSLYVVRDADDPSSALSSQRSVAEVEAIGNDLNTIWAQAGVQFDISVIEIEIPASVLTPLAANLDSDAFFAAVGREFEVPNPGALNGFYVRTAGRVNGVAPSSSRVFFVVDEPSVHDERVSSHEIGHLLGLHHDLRDNTTLMFSGTNGTTLSLDEQTTARYTAQGILNGAR